MYVYILPYDLFLLHTIRIVWRLDWTDAVKVLSLWGHRKRCYTSDFSEFVYRSISHQLYFFRPLCLLVLLSPSYKDKPLQCFKYRPYMLSLDTACVSAPLSPSISLSCALHDTGLTTRWLPPWTLSVTTGKTTCLSQLLHLLRHMEQRASAQLGGRGVRHSDLQVQQGTWLCMRRTDLREQKVEEVSFFSETQLLFTAPSWLSKLDPTELACLGGLCGMVFLWIFWDMSKINRARGMS